MATPSGYQLLTSKPESTDLTTSSLAVTSKYLYPLTLTFSFPNLSSIWDQAEYGPNNARVQELDDQGNPKPIQFGLPFKDINGVFYGPGVNLPGYAGLNDDEKSVARLAFKSWENVANIKFTETTESANNVGDFRIAFYSFALHESGLAAYCGYPANTPKSGDMWISDKYDGLNASDWAKGGFPFEMLVHELGHGLGLQHSFNLIGDDITSERLPKPGFDERLDSDVYTIMSYSRPYATFASTPMLFDIKAIQYLYGANTSFRTGNDTYSYNDNGTYLETIWDAGGTDTISYSGSKSIELNLEPGTSGSRVGKDVGGNNLFIAFGAQIENAIAGDGNDNLIGNELPNSLVGGVGNDSLDGGGGNDSISGGAGNDTIIGALGDDTLDGGSGTDLVSYLDAKGVMNIALVSGSVTLGGGLGVDTLINIEDLIASDFNDTLFGDANNNKIYGAGGNDTINGGAGNDSLYGGNGNDVFQLSSGVDYFDGGSGVDTFNFSGLISPVKVNFSTNTLSYRDQTMRFANIEGLTFSNQSESWTGSTSADAIFASGGNDTLDGGAGNDRLDGGSGNDSISGGVGNDTIIAGLGDDTLDGGSGIDFFSLSSSAYGLNVNLSDSSLRIVTSIGTKTIKRFEQFEATAFNDSILGSNFSDTILSGSGNDSIQGLNGNDWINVGLGNDSVDGGSGFDTIDLSDNRSNQVTSLVSGTSTSDGRIVRFSSVEGVVGGAGNDTITGTSLDDQLDGGGGANLIEGGLGNDRLFLSTASGMYQSNLFQSTLNGGEGIDTLELQGQGWAKLSNNKIYADFGYVGNFDYLDKDYSFIGHPADMNEAEATANLISIEKFVTSSSDDSVYLDMNFSGSIESGTGNDVIVALEAEFNPNIPVFNLNVNTGAGDDSFVMMEDPYFDISSSSGSVYARRSLTVNGGEGEDTFYIDLKNYDKNIYLGDSIAYLKYDYYGDQIFSLGYSGFENVTVGRDNGVSYGSATIYGSDKDNIIKNNEWWSWGDLIPDESISLESWINKVFAADGNDTIFYKWGMDIDGGQGNDVIVMYRPPESSRDIINGGQGTDTIKYQLANLGTTTVSLSDFSSVENLIAEWKFQGTEALVVTGTSVANHIETGNGNDSINGGYGNDSLYGGAGNDTFINVIGSDYIDGGDGTDTLTFADVSVNRRFILDIGVNMNLGPASASVVDLLYAINIENIIGGSGNDYFEGNALNNLLEGGGGNDTLYGAGGNDTLMGGAGDDEIYISIGSDSVDGGDGSDILAFRDLDQGIGVDLSIETQALGIDNSLNSNMIKGLKLVSIESLVGSSYADSLYGNSSNNHLSGEGGADVIDGAAGNDTLIGGSGNDTLAGGLGNDSLDGGAGNDTASYLKANRWVTVDLTKQSNQALGEGSDQLSGIENVWGSNYGDTIKGSLMANYLFGAYGNDTLIGLEGNDIVDGGEGNDSIDAGSGNDIIYGSLEDTIDGGIGNDILSFEKISGYFSVTLTTNFTSIETIYLSDDSSAYRDNEIGREIYGLNGLDEIYGNGGNDTIYGGAGVDDLYGGAGNDVLYAGDGLIDYLNGGEGNDRIYVGTGENDISLGAGQDTIYLGVSLNSFVRKTVTDFSSEDKIAFSKEVFTKLVSISAKNIVIGANARALDANDYIIYDSATGLLSYDKDGNGAAVSVVLMGLSNNLNITALNFMTYV